MRRPVFVVGSPRSGTTYFYHLLLSAGDFVIYHAETHVFNLAVPRYGALRRREDREEFLDEWLKGSMFEASGLSRDEMRGLVLDQCDSGGTFLRLLMETMAAKQGVNRWAECTPEHLLYVDEIKREIPDALFVHVIRDGRDVASSMSSLGWIKPLPGTRGGPLLAAGLFWEWVVRQGKANLQKHASDAIEVRYESLVRDPAGELERVGKFIDHDLDYDRILRNAVGTVKRPNTSFGKSSGAGFNPVGRWKKLPPEDLAMLETGIRELLTELGYERATEDAPSRMWIALERALYRTRFTARTVLKRDTPLGRYFTNAALLREKYTAST